MVLNLFTYKALTLSTVLGNCGTRMVVDLNNKFLEVRNPVLIIAEC